MRLPRTVTVAMSMTVVLSGCATDNDIARVPAEGSSQIGTESELRGSELRRRLFELADIMGRAAIVKEELKSVAGPDPTETIGEFLEFTQPHRERYQASLDRSRQALGELESLVQAARSGGYEGELRLDADIIDRMVDDWHLWLDAADYQNDESMMCPHLFSDLDQTFADLAENVRWFECFTKNLSDPIIQLGSFDAAARLQDIGPVIAAAWRN